jgi:hypothetical protein
MPHIRGREQQQERANSNMAIIRVEAAIFMIVRQCAMGTLLRLQAWMVTRRILLAFVQLMASFIYDGQTSVRAEANACEREMILAAKRYDVPLAVLYAVGLTETQRWGLLSLLHLTSKVFPYSPQPWLRPCNSSKGRENEEIG